MRFFGRKGRALLIAVLVAIKIVLSIFTPAGVEVYFYLTTVAQPKMMPVTAYVFAQSPWGRWYNGTLAAWNALPIEHPSIEGIWRTKSILLNPSLHVLLFMAKLPMLGADLAVALILYALGRRLFPGSNMAAYASIIWLANPYVTFVNEMMGAIDVVPVACLTLALFFMLGNRRLFSFLSLSAGAAIKLFPVLLLPAFLYAARAKGTRSLRLMPYGLLVVLGFIGYVLWAASANAVFWFGYTPLTQPITEFILAKQTMSLGYYGGGDFIGLATFSVVLVYLAMYEFRPSQFADLAELSLIVLLVYLTFLDIQVQYVLWAAPILTLENLARKRTVVPSALIYISSFLLGFMTDGYQTYSGYSLLFFNLQKPSNPFEAGIHWVLQSPLIDLLARPLVRTALASLMIVIIILVVYSARKS